MDQSASNPRIAFIDISVFEDGSIRGGVLVTDTESRPYEFRVTSPIKPTQLQKILYGNSLADYVYGELICLPLLNQVKEKITLAVCRNENMLLARPGLQFPLVAIKKSATETQEDVNTIIIRHHKNFAGEKAQAEFLITSMGQRFDIFEPFDRVNLAVSEVHKQKIDLKV